MASVRKRVSKDSRSVTWAVLFRHNQRQTSMTFTTEKAAEDFRTLLTILSADKALATLAAPVDGLTVDQLAEKFFEWKGRDVEPRTIRDYRRDYANWISPKVGHRSADSIDEVDVQNLVDDWSGRLDPKSVTDRHAILSGMYKFGSARTRKHVSHNPCLETQLPKRKKKPPKGFALAEWEAMHVWGAVHEPDADDLLLHIASTGWRFSEATAATPASIEDYGDEVVTVNGVSVVVPNLFATVLGVHRRDDQDRMTYAEGRAKSEDSLRRINLPPAGARMIRRRLAGLGPRDLLFTSPTGKQWRSNNFLEREFARILAGAGIPKVKGMGPHYLRHLHVAALDRGGVSTAKTQRRIGHANISTTFDVYGGMIGNTLTVQELLALDAQLVPDRRSSGAVVAGEVVRELG